MFFWAKAKSNDNSIAYHTKGICAASINRRPDLYVIYILTKFSHYAEARADQCVYVCVWCLSDCVRRVGCWLRRATAIVAQQIIMNNNKIKIIITHHHHLSQQQNTTQQIIIIIIIIHSVVIIKFCLR